jgi:DNA-binding beta-propeller fold protein YncE
MPSHLRWSCLPAILSASFSAPALAADYTLFESGQVRPLALSADRTTLAAVNTPDGTLELFDVGPAGLTRRATVPVGLEPVAVAFRTNQEAWVVNHLSDSVSVVSAGKGAPNRVVRTLLVGDEPRDIVFAGPGKHRAFITAAHRGQHGADPQLTTPGVGRADVWVFDGLNLGASLGGAPLAVITLFADTPRALAATPDGATVYAAAHFSGNRTTTVHRVFVPNADEADGGAPDPSTDHTGLQRPHAGLIVRHDGAHWVDELGRAWDEHVKFDLPDRDVFAIDATGPVPTPLTGPNASFSGVGTVLFNMIVNPASGKIYVTNTEARNERRFEGPGLFAGQTLRGRFAENRISVLDPATRAVDPRHLNPHIDVDACCAPLPNEENELSLALPQGMAITADGQRLYVAALGSDKLGVYDTAQLDTDTFWPDPAEQIPLTGGGPTGLVLDEPRDRLYVLTRFDNAVAAIDTDTGDELQHIALRTPEPANIVAGRRFLYDARHTSSHGDSACASCHVFGDMDHLAWDLGDPDGDLRTAPGPFKFVVDPSGIDFHPMKGPMTTQSLRGMANHGPMHWRGDRTGGYAEASAQPDDGAFDEVAAFAQFNPAFVGLLGRDSELAPAEMQAFSDFALRLTYPPNPIRALDNSLTAEQQKGRDLYMTLPAALGMTCNFCHVLDPAGNAQHGVAAPGFFGTDGQHVGGELPQTLKIPHLRNLYQKVGKFGLPADPLINHRDSPAHTGEQVRGFGFIHDGAIDTVFRFIGAFGFDVIDADDPTGVLARRRVEAFLLAFDSNLAPIVGQQITLTSGNAAVAGPRVTLLTQRAQAGECDLVAHAVVADQPQGFLYSGGLFLRDRTDAPALTDAQLRQLAAQPGQEVTYTCTPPGSGQRIARDRNRNNILDGDEVPRSGGGNGGDDDDDDDDDDD